MISIRLTRDPTHAAVLVRLVAFLVAAVSVFVIPAALAAAASGTVAPHVAFAAAGVAFALTLLATLVARSLDPLR